MLFPYSHDVFDLYIVMRLFWMRKEIEEDRKIVHAFSRSRGEDSLIQLVLLVIVLSNKVIIYLFIYLSILN